MNVYLNEMTGIADAIVSMYLSKRSWTRERELHIREICGKVLRPDGRWRSDLAGLEAEVAELDGWLGILAKWGWTHVTMLRFVDMSITVEGLHRAGQDDWDAHAVRFNNRIIRSSTRLATFDYEMSQWYEDKIMPTDLALAHLGLNVPDTLEKDGVSYVKTVNGYIRADLADNKDVKRGLYMLSIPSNFIFKINLAEWSHVYKERNQNGTANPEVKLCCEAIADQIEGCQPRFNRELFLKVKI